MRLKQITLPILLRPPHISQFGNTSMVQILLTNVFIFPTCLNSIIGAKSNLSDYMQSPNLHKDEPRKTAQHQKAWSVLKHGTSQFSPTQSSLNIIEAVTICPFAVCVLCTRHSFSGLFGVALWGIQCIWQLMECRFVRKNTKRADHKKNKAQSMSFWRMFRTLTGSWQDLEFMRRKCLFQEHKQKMQIWEWEETEGMDKWECRGA